MPIRRTLKNVVKNYSDAQIKVREATSNDPWGPSSTLMSEIADLTYNVVAFTEIMQMVWKRLNDHGKNWRHVYKALVLLDYLIKTGSEKVAQQCKENIFAIQTLKDFQHIEEGKDHGMNVRERAKQLVGLLKDDERLKNERAKALKAKERFAQSATTITPSRHESDSPTLHHSSSGGGYSDYSLSSHPPPTSAASNVEMEAARPSTAGEEELQLQLALAMSKEEHDEEEKKRKADEVKYQLAIEESKRENDTGYSGREAGSTHRAPGPAHRDTLLEMSDRGSGGNDPWGGLPLSDPWAPSSTLPPSLPPPGGPQPSTNHDNDPWGSTPIQPPSLPTPVNNDPWAPVANNTTTAMNNDPWNSPSSHPTNGTTAPPVEDEFDLLSSRSKSPANTHHGELMGGGGNLDPWDMTGMGDNLMHPQTNGNKQKSPADFLGENANLVNLDNLVPKPAEPSTNNPFAMTINPTQSAIANPFDHVSKTDRVPMNMMTTSQSMGSGFSSTTQSTMPQPLVPMAGGTQPLMPLQPHTSNPFL